MLRSVALASALALGCSPDVFIDAAPDLGLVFQHSADASGKKLIPEIMGSGVALLDYDLDGDLDVYAIQAGRNRLFRNDQVVFVDVTVAAYVGEPGYGMGAAVGDIDNDGDPDLYVTNVGPNALLLNSGDGTFRDATAEAGVGDSRWGASASFFDYDRDGDLDLFVTNYVLHERAERVTCRTPAGELEFCGPMSFDPAPDVLYRNDGGGHFSDVSRAAGLDRPYGSGLGVVAADFDADGWPDVYVANDGRANQLWRNNHDGTFENVGLFSGTAYNQNGAPEAGMGVTAGDFDADGDTDLFLSHLDGETNTLYVNDGKGLFSDGTVAFDLASASTPSTGFGTEWFDYDNDGRLDLFIANGAVNLEPEQRGRPFPYRQKNQLFQNVDDEAFVDVSAEGGEAFDFFEVSRGAAFGDIDNDGDTDIVVSNNSGPLRLLLNQAGTRNRWLQVKLIGTDSNRDAYGAHVAITLRDGRTLRRRVHADGSYLSSNDPLAHFGLGTEGDVAEIEVQWPNGRREVWEGVAPNQRIELEENSGAGIVKLMP